MDPRAVAGVVVYAALIASLALPAYDGDDWLPVLTILAAAHLGLGAAVRRPWALVPPIALCLVAFFADGADGLAWMLILIAAPALAGLTLAGWGMTRLLPRDVAALACLAVAAIPVTMALVETADAARRKIERDLRRQAEVLLRELGARPTHLVTDTEYDADSGDEHRRDITIRRLAENQLDEMQPDCAPDLQRRLRSAL